MKTATLLGIEAVPVEIHVNFEKRLPAFNIVGLPSTAARETQERVRAAIAAAGYEFPRKRITVSLEPSDVIKYGSHYDLPIALAIIDAAHLAHTDLNAGYLAVGSLGLDGSVRSISGSLALRSAYPHTGIICPADNAAEAALDTGAVYGVRTLGEAVDLLTGIHLHDGHVPHRSVLEDVVDMREVRGHAAAKAALEKAAIEGTHVLLQGPAGCGKDMLACRFRTILPKLTDKERLEVLRIASAAGLLASGAAMYVQAHPFRAPHHTCSTQALLGGGVPVRPGEVTLAHRGILFLDEIQEFPRHVLAGLRQPLEEKRVTVARSDRVYEFPADFQLIATANYCPCGRLPLKDCRCETHHIKPYQARVDRIVEEMGLTKIDVPYTDFGKYPSPVDGEPSETIRKRVEEARTRCAKG